MSLSLQPNFVTKTNSTLPLALTAGIPGLAIRVASLASDILGTLTASGAAGVIAFTISSSAPSFITGTVDQTGTIFTLSFSNALPNGSDPYEFYVTVTDGITTLYYPILLEVKQPFAIQAVGNGTSVASTGSTTFNIQSFDSTVADVVIEGIGLNNSQVTGISFVPPITLPTGLNFVNKDGSTLALHVSEPSVASVSGGVQLVTPTSAPVTISAYLPGSFYDEPDRAFTKTFQVSSLTSKVGTLDYMTDVYYDNVNSRFQLDVIVDYLQGQGHALQYAWTQSAGTAVGTFSGATGNVINGIASTQWTPSIGGTVAFTVTISDQTAPHPVYAIKTFGPFQTSTGSGSWSSTSAIKLQLSTAPGNPGLYQGYVGDVIEVTVSSVANAEFNSSEIFYLTPTIETGSALETAIPVPAVASVTNVGINSDLLTVTAINTFSSGQQVAFYGLSSATFLNGQAVVILTASPTQFTATFTHANYGPASDSGGFAQLCLSQSQAGLGNFVNMIPLTIPAATLRQKWGLRITATNQPTGSPPGTRFGFVEASLRTFGNKTLVINGGGPIGIATSTGSTMTPVSLAATDVETTSPVVATFFLVGAPDGVFINASNQIIGNALAPGVFTFLVTARATGYANSYSNTVTLTVSQNATPLQITQPSVIGATLNPPSEIDNSNFNVQWAISGTPTSLLFLQSTSTNGSRNVLGTTQAATTQPTTSVISVFGSSYFGTAYSVPIIVLSSSIQASSALLPAPTIGTLDENFNLTVNWQPFLVNGGYTIYKDWDIFVTKVPGGTPQLQTINGNLPTGLEFPGSSLSNRIYESVLAVGDFTLNMTALTSNPSIATNSPAWDSSHQFPTTLTNTSVTLSASTLLLGQPVTIALDPSYTGADVWSVTYSDNTTTGFVPLSVRSFAKSFSTPGTQTIVITTQSDFLNNTPQVRLRRQITLTVYVTNQQFVSGQAGAGDLTGTLGISGTQGFEITDATTALVTPEPWEVVSRSLVRDSVTNELKLLVATSRFADASSLLDTMAVDVFPIQGRPLAIDLIQIPELLEVTTNTGQTPVKLVTTQLPSVIVGKAMTEFKLQASGGIAPYSWYTDASLPFGVNLSIDGTLSGTPLELGTFNVNFSVKDSSTPESIADQTFAFIIATDLVITTATLPAATVNTPYSVQVTNTGGLPPFTWAVVSGAFPQGITINASTGLLSGSPVTYNSTTDFLALYNATIEISDSIGAKVSKAFSMQLNPAALSFGPSNQTIVYGTDQFKLTVPVFGGKSPYSLTNFTDDGVIGSGLQIVNPTLVSIVGVAPPTLTITTGNQTFYPQAAVDIHGNFTNPLGVPVSFGLAFTGGVTPVQFSIDTTAANTLPGNGTGGLPQVFGTELLGVAQANGTFTVGVKAIDAVGHIATSTINVTIQAQNSAPYVIQASIINLNGNSTNPAAWSVTALPNAGQLHDAQIHPPSTGYSPGAGEYYGFVLYENFQPYYLISSHLQSAVFGTVSGSGSSPLQSDGGWLSAGIPAGAVLPAGYGPNVGNPPQGIILLGLTAATPPGVPTQYSWQTRFTNITQPSTSVLATAVERESLQVTSSGSSTTPVVVVVSTSAITIDLATTPGAWLYPLVAEGGTGPYTFQIQSGTTLPGVTLTGGVDSTNYFTTSTAGVGTYTVMVKATDSASNVSAVATISVTIVQSPQQPIHILNNNLPPYLYAGRPIPSNTYYIQSDLVANWSATGLPAGVTLTSAAATRTYLQGNPTTPGTSTVNVTATSASFGTFATQSFPLAIRARSAAMVNFPASAVKGVAYRAINNNAILNVSYVGYQPTDVDLPLLVSANGTVGAPGVTNGGQPTTQVSNLTFDGFNMAYDYTNAIVGNDTISAAISLSPFVSGTISGLPHALAIVYPTLIATGLTPPANVVSEYAATATFAAPVTITGGNAPYSINITGESDSRFVPVGNPGPNAQLTITVNQFSPGGTYTCTVPMTVTDTETSPQTSSTTGVLTVQIKVETTITVTYNNQPWNITAVSTPNVYSLVLPVAGVSVQLAHFPVQYNVTSVVIPGGLTGKVQVSPTNRVIAINTTGSPANVSDSNNALQPSGSYTVTNVSTSGLAGSYTIGVNYQVIDAHGIVSTGSANVNVTIS